MSTAVKTVWSTQPNKHLRDTCEMDKLKALCTGVDLLSQLVATGDESNPRLRAQLLQLSSALVKLECSMGKSGMPSGYKETSSKLFKPVLPTPRGKLVLIIERLKQAFINQHPTPSGDNSHKSNADIVSAACCDAQVETGWKSSEGEHVNQIDIECVQKLLPSLTSLPSAQTPPPPQSSPPSQSPPPSQTPQPSQSLKLPPSSLSLSPGEQLTTTQTHSSYCLGSSRQPQQLIKLNNNTKPELILQISPSVIPPPPPPPSPITDSLSFSFLQHTVPCCPHAPLKPLFWKKVPCRSALSNSGIANIWMQVSEPSLTDKKLFIELFAKKEASPYKSATKTGHKKSCSANKRPVMLLGGRRSQAVSIMLHSLPCEVTELSEEIRRGAAVRVNKETLQALHDLQATAEELDLINRHLRLPDSAPLDKPEMFLHTMSDIPQFPERLVCLLYSQTLPESSASIMSELSVYRRLSHELRHSTKLLQILGMVLTLGNVMNFGNQVRGAASGYQLEILPKLRDVKTADRSSNLLKFLVHWYLQQTDSPQATLDLKFPLPDPGDIMTLTKLDFDLLHTRASEYNSKLDCFKKDLKKVLNSSPQNLLQPFKARMEAHLQQFECDSLQLTAHIEYYEKDFQSLVQYYCMVPPPGQSSVDPAYFFSVWHLFMMQFQEDWKQRKIEMAKEKLREEELQRRNEAVIRPLSSSGLKSKLARHFK